MSVKAMSLVWDLPCPTNHNGKDFKPGHKFVLLGYADHADHFGKNIYPAVMTIASKTGYDERSVQRLTNELNEMGLLLPDGQGPRGTNRWMIPFDGGGDKISPLTKNRGDISSGDIPSGDIPSGDKMSPELKESTQNDINLNTHIDIWDRVTGTLKNELKKAEYQTWIEPLEVGDGDMRTLVLYAHNKLAKEWVEKKMIQRIQELSGLFVKILISESV